MNQTVYAIVVTYNGAKWVDKCFSSLVNSSIPLKILAIDNSSSDGTPTLIREKFPQVEVIETGKNLGFGKANNIGLKRVLDENADYAFLLNQDAWVEKDTIEKLVEVHKAHPEFGLLSPVPYDGNETVLDYLYAQFYQNGINLENEYNNKTYEIKFINAAAWLMSNELLKDIGGFHPKFKMYGEDKNYIDRIHYLNKWKIGITQNSKYFHDRESRYESEITSKQNIFKSKVRIKTEFLNPNISKLRTLYNVIRYNTIILIRKKQPLKTWGILVFYSFGYFTISFINKKIHITP